MFSTSPEYQRLISGSSSGTYYYPCYLSVYENEMTGMQVIKACPITDEFSGIPEEETEWYDYGNALNARGLRGEFVHLGHVMQGTASCLYFPIAWDAMHTTTLSDIDDALARLLSSSHINGVFYIHEGGADGGCWVLSDRNCLLRDIQEAINSICPDEMMRLRDVCPDDGSPCPWWFPVSDY